PPTLPPPPQLAIAPQPEPTQPLQIVEPTQTSAALSAELLSMLRASLRGKTQEELASMTEVPPQNLVTSLFHLEQQGQVIRRGQKYFIA
ncbi:MAG: hypothetical protein FWC28_04920, partial [Proteobacteria bacterium]|nr:hypothetical protein [Pseudomonadota bacterium]